MNTFSTKKIFVISLVLCLVVYALLLFFFLEIKSANERVLVLLDEVERKEQQNESDESDLALLVGVGQDIQLLDTYLVSEDEVVGFISLIELLGRENNIDVETSSINIEHVEKGNRYFLTIALSVEGDWSRMYDFLRQIEVLPYVVTLSQVAFFQTETVTETGEVSVGWQGKVVFGVLMAPPRER